jgi:hypothetical protein
VKAEVRDAVEFADNSPVPPLSDLYHDVYREPWGRYTGTSEPLMYGGAMNPPTFRATREGDGLI